MKKNMKRLYKITLLILLAIIVLMAVSMFYGCQKAPYYRNEVNLPFTVDSLVKMTNTDLTQYLGRPTSDFDTFKTWLVYFNGQRILIHQTPGEIEIIKTWTNQK